jgi:hypothetical protein
MSERKRYVATENDERYYWERVRRNLGWLGDTVEKQKERQLKLKNAVIGVADPAVRRQGLPMGAGRRHRGGL